MFAEKPSEVPEIDFQTLVFLKQHSPDEVVLVAFLEPEGSWPWGWQEGLPGPCCSHVVSMLTFNYLKASETRSCKCFVGRVAKAVIPPNP